MLISRFAWYRGTYHVTEGIVSLVLSCLIQFVFSGGRRLMSTFSAQYGIFCDPRKSVVHFSEYARRIEESRISENLTIFPFVISLIVRSLSRGLHGGGGYSSSLWFLNYWLGIVDSKMQQRTDISAMSISFFFFFFLFFLLIIARHEKEHSDDVIFISFKWDASASLMQFLFLKLPSPPWYVC